MEADGAIRVLIAENEWRYADALACGLIEEADIVVVGIVGTAEEAVERTAALRPLERTNVRPFSSCSS